jgi:hypothetical protein
MWVIVGVLTFIVTCLVADRVDDHGLHGTTAAAILGFGTVAAVAVAVAQWW